MREGYLIAMYSCIWSVAQLLNIKLFTGQTKKHDSSRRYISVDQARLPDGLCVYAIGDIHGMSRLAKKMTAEILSQIEQVEDRIEIIVLGDMIDRGPDSSGTLEALLEVRRKHVNRLSLRLLKGNHEQMLLDFLHEPERAGTRWLANGGDATLQSYGIRIPHHPKGGHYRLMRDELMAVMPAEHINCLSNLQSSLEIGDYFFCHAGVRTGHILAEQSEEDLLWLRAAPEDVDLPFERVVVHGHRPVHEPTAGRHHINVDTGAYATGRLTAIRLRGSDRQFMSTDMSETKETID